MNQDGLQTSFWVMVLVQTIGSVDMPGHGERKMPAPRQYLSIVLTWLVLQVVSSINAGTERAAAAIGWSLVVTGMVVGPFGQRVISLYNNVAASTAPSGATVAGTSAATTANAAVSGIRTAGQGASQAIQQTVRSGQQ